MRRRKLLPSLRRNKRRDFPLEKDVKSPLAKRVSFAGGLFSFPLNVERFSGNVERFSANVGRLSGNVRWFSGNVGRLSGNVGRLSKKLR